MDYLFPQDGLSDRTDEALFELITLHLPTASDSVDGTDCCLTDVHIDYAQDVIEQVRDVLVGRGVAIPAELREKLTFLDWRTPAEKAAQQAAAEAADRERAAAVLAAVARLRPLAETFRQEAQSFLLPSRPRLSIRLDEIAPQLRLEVKVEHSTSTKFQEMKQRFEHLLGQQVDGWCVGSRWGIAVDDDSDVSFTLRLPVCSDGRLYAGLRNLVCSSPAAQVLIRLEGDEFGAWELVTEPFETLRRNSKGWGAVQGMLEAAPTVFA